MKTHKVYIALGSNMNGPRQQIDQAIASISALPQTTLIAQSPYFETKPMGYLQQDHFVNAACCIETSLEPEHLLAELHAIEQAQGRIRTFKNGPRTVDCDIVIIDDLTIKTSTLTVPHPGLLEREFVLVPLQSMEPDLILPNGLTVSEHLLRNPIEKTVVK